MAISYSEYQDAQRDLMTAQSRQASLQISIIQANNQKNAAVASGDEAGAAAAEAKAASRTQMLADTESDIAKYQGQINEFNGSPAVKSESTVATEQKYANATVVDTTDTRESEETERKSSPEFGKREVPGVPFGAQPMTQSMPKIIFRDVSGKKMGEDLRVKIRVPPKYLTRFTKGLSNELIDLGGIIFPYTPSISYELKADYASTSPTHSNFAINFYQKSSVGSISISGKFSVENANDAGAYLATVHLLRALTRMRSGGASGGDTDSGAPPPVCRLDAYGDMMLNNVPVAISSFKVELPDGVDYYTLPDHPEFGANSVPTMSTLSVTCVPMYSRDEMQKFSVTGYLEKTSFRNKGYI